MLAEPFGAAPEAPGTGEVLPVSPPVSAQCECEETAEQLAQHVGMLADQLSALDTEEAGLVLRVKALRGQLEAPSQALDPDLMPAPHIGAFHSPKPTSPASGPWAPPPTLGHALLHTKEDVLEELLSHEIAVMRAKLACTDPLVESLQLGIQTLEAVDFSDGGQGSGDVEDWDAEVESLRAQLLALEAPADPT